MSQVKFLYWPGPCLCSTSAIDRDLIPGAKYYKKILPPYQNSSKTIFTTFNDRPLMFDQLEGLCLSPQSFPYFMLMRLLMFWFWIQNHFRTDRPSQDWKFELNPFISNWSLETGVWLYGTLAMMIGVTCKLQCSHFYTIHILDSQR